MTLSLHSLVIGSAHGLTERNIWVKLNENRPMCSGDMELTHNSRVNPLTLICVLDLESRQLGHTVSLRETLK